MNLNILKEISNPKKLNPKSRNFDVPSKFNIVIEDMKIAVSEACTNSIQHAYQETAGRILITCRLTKDKIAIEIKDDGQGFDVSELGTPEQQQKSLEKKGMGLGLTFIKNLMDEMNIDTKSGQGTTIKMAKSLPVT